eukprot:gene3793-8371_t
MSYAVDMCKKTRTWDEMIEDLRILLTSEDVLIEDVEVILKSYVFMFFMRDSDWRSYSHFDDHCYTRNLVDGGNGKYNLMLLCWDMGQASSIHDHAGSHCFMKILDGTLTEELFAPPSELENAQCLEARVEASHDRDGVLYISDKIGTHRVSNPSHSRRAVSLHLYSPPYSVAWLQNLTTVKKELLYIYIVVHRSISHADGPWTVTLFIKKNFTSLFNNWTLG